MKVSNALAMGALAATVLASPAVAKEGAKNTADKTSARVAYSLQAVPPGFGWDTGDVVGEGHLLGSQWIYRLKSGMYICYRKDSDGSCKEYARIQGADPKTFECFITQKLSYRGGNETNWCRDDRHVWDGNNGFKRLDVSPKGLAPIVAATSCGTDEVRGYTVGKQTYSVDGRLVSAAEAKDIRAKAEARSAQACIGD